MIEKTVPGTDDAQAEREPTRSEESYTAPPVDIYETEQGLAVVADLPGVDPADLDVRVDRGILTIQGRAGHAATGDIVHREHQLTGFFRQFQLSDEVDTARIEAEMKHGVLYLQLPRVQEATPRRIQVQARP